MIQFEAKWTNQVYDAPWEQHPIKCVVNYSGGVCSFLAAERATKRFNHKEMMLLFADTGVEHSDMLRFMREGAKYLRVNLVEVRNALGMDGLIESHKMIPSNMAAFCSIQLKREPAEQWIKENAPNAMQVFGIDWSENRLKGLIKRFGDKVWCPMTEPPYLLKSQMLAIVEGMGLTPSESYALGFQHDNCSGGCVKAGHAAWAHLLRTRPDVYEWWEAKEAHISRLRGKPCTILRDRSGGKTRPLPLWEFRSRVSANAEFDTHDWGGCGCFTEAP